MAIVWTMVVVAAVAAFVLTATVATLLGCPREWVGIPGGMASTSVLAYYMRKIHTVRR